MSDAKREFEALKARFEARLIDRREFLGRAGAMAAVGGISPLLAAKRAVAQTPVRGGKMVLGSRHGSTSDSLDPALLTNGLQWAIAFARSATLTEIDVDGRPAPSLATSWEASPDARTWTFALRSGVEFHNGKPLTPEDVIASIAYHRGETSKSFVKPFADQIEDMRIDGQNVVLELTAGNVDFPAYLASAGFLILPSEDGKLADPTTKIGCGGYVLESYEPGVRATLARNPNYWRDDRAFVDEIELLTIADAAARTSALITGEVNAIDQVDLRTIHLLSRHRDLVVDEISGPLHYTFPMLTQTAPFDDVHVRLALKHAIDRQEMLQKILKGRGTIGNDTPIGPSYSFHADDIEQTAFDPDKAKFHLNKAGLSDLTVDLSAADAAFAGAVDAAQLFQETAKKSGITINVKRVPNDGYWSNVWLKEPFCACYWGGYTTESEMFSTGYAPGAAWNDTQWTHERFEKLRIEAQSELDTERRGEIYREMQLILRDEGGVIVPFFANHVMGRSTRIQHGRIGADRAFDGARICERWWVV